MKNELKEPGNDPEKLEKETGTPELQESTEANGEELSKDMLNLLHRAFGKKDRSRNPFGEVLDLDSPQAQEVWDDRKDRAEREGVGKEYRAEEYKELKNIAERWKAEYALVAPPAFQFTGEVPRYSSILSDEIKARETLPGHKEELERLSQWYDEWNTYSQEDKLRRYTRVIQLEGRGGLQEARNPDIDALARRIEEQINKLERVVEIEQKQVDDLERLGWKKEDEELGEAQSGIEKAYGEKKPTEEVKVEASEAPTEPVKKKGGIGRFFRRSEK